MIPTSAIKNRGRRILSGTESIRNLRACAELLSKETDTASIAEVVARQIHNAFDPVQAAIILETAGRLKLAAFAGSNDNLQSRLNRQLVSGQGFFVDLFRQTLADNGPEFHQLKSPVTGLYESFESIYCIPVRTEHSSILFCLFLTPEQNLGENELSFVAALGQITGIALVNAELRASSDPRSGGLQELLDICAEVGSEASLEKFLERFVIRAASFLEYRASFIALVENGICRMRWASRDGLSRRLQVELDSVIVRRVLATKEPFWSEEAQKDSDINSELLLSFRVDQLFAIPLIGANGECLGILGLLDRLDRKPISPEDVRRANALAGQATVALEWARNLDISEQHRRRAEALVSFALDLGASVELEELVSKFTSRGMELLEARASFMALVRAGHPQTVLLQSIGNEQERAAIHKRLARALETVIARSPLKWVVAVSGEKFDRELARDFGWRQVIITPLFGSGEELLALFGLVDCRKHSPADFELVQAMATHAAAALQNSQLFTRITRSSRQWAEMFDSISDLMLLHDEHQRILRVNRSLSGKLNTQPAELLGSFVRELFGLTPGTPACPFCLDLRGQEFREEFREPKTGKVYLVSSSRLRGVPDETQQIVHVLKDVTASRRAERLYRDLFDNIQEGAYFSAPDGSLIEVNDALVRMLGYNSREELLSVKADNLYVDPGHREITTRALNQFGRLRNHELALLRRDRSIIYVLENSFVVRDEAGKVLEYRGVLLDITEIKNVQSQLLREHDFNTQILNHTQSLIAVIDTAGLVSYANRRCCEVAGSEGDLVGSRLETIVVPSHRGVLRSALECALDGKAVNNLELPLSRGREVIGSFSVNLSPMRSPRGEVNSLVAVMTDITDVAMLQAKLMHAEKMAAVGQLVSGVAHEVNNPLTAILGFADLLLENPDLSGDVKEDLQVIVHETQRTREIVQNLLSFARQTRPEKQAVDVNSVLRRTVSLRAYDMGSHGIELREEFDASLPEITADAHQLQQVFLNILNNACDAVREARRRGRIVIATERLKESVEVRFRDNGTGISSPDRIFDPFYTTKEVGKGTGLGLSICYGIIREHNGEIVCFNNHDSEGATFAIRLPLQVAEIEAKAMKAAAR